ncbi:DUF1924 domain-containing protein [Oceanospirillum sanctuarii]|uniref:DUF1924 domain-containing protein n=1 Tax=Oceanospirillum sanctuarii TaxID=1434821 RepID=UPI000A36796F|nr:DUF1924 domain-containing protein [Oceanospirillum sanctuarii]
MLLTPDSSSKTGSSSKTSAWILSALLLTLAIPSYAQSANPVVEQLLKEYRSEGVTEFSSTRDGNLWQQSFDYSKAPASRSCTSCHGKDIRQKGLHIRTQKEIKPLAPSINPSRLTDEKQIRKWLKRNCKWTLGRECSPQEKGDLLLWIQSQ